MPKAEADVPRVVATMRAALVTAGFEWTQAMHVEPWDAHEYERREARQSAIVAVSRKDADSAQDLGWVARTIVESI